MRVLALGQGEDTQREGYGNQKGGFEARPWSGEFLMVIEVQKTVSVTILGGNMKKSFGITDFFFLSYLFS